LECKIISDDCLRNKKLGNYSRIDRYRMILISKKIFLTTKLR